MAELPLSLGVFGFPAHEIDLPFFDSIRPKRLIEKKNLRQAVSSIFDLHGGERPTHGAAVPNVQNSDADGLKLILFEVANVREVGKILVIPREKKEHLHWRPNRQFREQLGAFRPDSGFIRNGIKKRVHEGEIFKGKSQTSPFKTPGFFHFPL